MFTASIAILELNSLTPNILGRFSTIEKSYRTGVPVSELAKNSGFIMSAISWSTFNPIETSIGESNMH